MKKLKLLSFAVLPLALGLLASCGENTDAKVKVNSGDDKVMTKLEKEQDADYEEWFKLENQNLKAGDSLSFTYKGNDVSEKVIPEILLPGNNLDEDLKIINDADAASITLKVYKDDVYSAIVSGFVAPEPPEPDKYTVSKAAVTNGTLSLSKEGELVEGDQVTATATAAEGYTLKEITINGEAVSTASSYTFTVSEELADEEDKIVVGATFKVASDPYKIANQEQWTAAFGADKTFFIADNCKIELESTAESMPTSNTSFIIDGNKMEEIENGQSTYASYENGTYYAYTTLKPQNVWTKNATTKEHVQAEITRFFEPFADMSVFTYDETTHTYVASEVTIEGVYFEEAKVNFENGKLMAVYGKAIQEIAPSLSLTLILDGTITYGGQSVTLPQVDPEPEPKGLKIEGLEEVWVGDTLVLTASALPAGATLKDEVTWSIDSGDDYVSLPEVKTGTSIEVTGVAEGTATIKATCGSLPAAYHIIEVKDSPAPSDVCLMGGPEGEWNKITDMYTGASETEYVAENVTVYAGDRIKVKNGPGQDDYCSTWKTTEGDTNAFLKGVCALDADGNAKFIVDATINVMYESAQEGGQGYGVYVELKNVNSQYYAVGTYQGQSQRVKFNFNEVKEGGIVEYKASIPEGYVNPVLTYTIQENDDVLDVTVEPYGEGPHFKKGEGNTYKYDGSATKLDLYLKETLETHTFGLYVENPDAPKVDTVYLAPGVWNVDGATFSAYFFNDQGNTWVPMVEDNGNFKATIPDGYSKVIFTRVNPNGQEQNPWDNVWNQTADLDVPTTNENKYTITGWGDQGQPSPGSWGTL